MTVKEVPGQQKEWSLNGSSTKGHVCYFQYLQWYRGILILSDHWVFYNMEVEYRTHRTHWNPRNWDAYRSVWSVQTWANLVRTLTWHYEIAAAIYFTPWLPSVPWSKVRARVVYIEGRTDPDSTTNQPLWVKVGHSSLFSPQPWRKPPQSPRKPLIGSTKRTTVLEESPFPPRWVERNKDETIFFCRLEGWSRIVIDEMSGYHLELEPGSIGLLLEVTCFLFKPFLGLSHPDCKLVWRQFTCFCYMNEEYRLYRWYRYIQVDIYIYIYI